MVVLLGGRKGYIGEFYIIDFHEFQCPPHWIKELAIYMQCIETSFRHLSEPEYVNVILSNDFPYWRIQISLIWIEII